VFKQFFSKHVLGWHRWGRHYPRVLPIVIGGGRSPPKWVEINAACRANEDRLFSDNRPRRFELLFNTIEYMASPRSDAAMPAPEAGRSEELRATALLSAGAG